jgi:uncharacterized membrane protein YkoI
MLWLWLAAAGAATAATPTAPLRVASAPVSMDQAIKMVEQRFHARVVKAETHKDGGRSSYVLRLLDPSGKVWTVRVNAADGSIE